MGFSLSGLFKENGQIQGQTGADKTAPSLDSAGHGTQTRGIVPGRTISGEVISRSGNEVRIRINEETVIQARLDKQISVTEGQVLTFEVKRNGENQLALRPLFENLSQDPNLLKALQAAGIQANTKSLALVSGMMEQGLSIDKASLQQAYKEVMTLSGATPEGVVSLHQLGIEVTEENLQQIRQYSNLEHQILNGVEAIAEKLDETILGLVDTEGNAGAAQAVQLLKELVQIFTKETSALELKELPSGGTEEHVGNIPEDHVKHAAPEENAANMQTQEAIVEAAVKKEQQAEHTGPAQETTGQMPPAEKNPFAALEGAKEHLPLSNAEQQILSEHLKQLGVPENTIQELWKGTLSTGEVLQRITDFLAGGEITGEAVRRLVSSREFKKLFRNEIERNMLLEPAKAADKKAVEQLYERIYEQTGKLSKLLSQIGRADTPLAKSVNNMRSNVEFMNQLNQTFSYIQLPLKLSGQNANGDLYVYTNKRNVTEKDGSVSALLHLDMKHLGAVDVYVAMREGNVSTKFYLENEELLDFVEAHLPLLNERLEKRGYHMQAEMIHKAEGNSAVKELLEQQNTHNRLVSSRSFDVRA